MYEIVHFKGITHLKTLSALNVIFWIVMGKGIGDLGHRGLRMLLTITYTAIDSC